MEFDRQDLKKFVFFLWKEGKSSAPDITKRINLVLGNETISVRTVQYFCAKFKENDFEIEEKPRTGRPEKVDDINDKIAQCLEEDKCHLKKHF